MKIGIIGYGKMGQTVESIAKERGHSIAFRADRGELDAGMLKDADVAIEFTTPEAAPENIRKCIEAGVPVVVGTTGWYEHYGELSKLADRNNGALFTATNFSIGVNLFFAVNRYLARIMDAYEQYDVELEETHHIHKLDAPSGTAITLAEGVLDELGRKNKWVCQEGDTGIDTTALDLKITAYREDEVPGTHLVRYTSAIDDIEIKHTAKGRKGFALGAVMAAEWLPGKKGVYSMKDLLNI